MSADRAEDRAAGARARARSWARREAAVPRGPYNATPIFVKEAKGAVLDDVDGNRLLDFAGGIGCLNVGHANEAVVRAAAAQLAQLTHGCFHVTPYEGYVRMAERMNALVPGAFAKKTFFANSGAEAVENAVKIARAATGRPAVLAFEDGFHGRTLLALSLTSKVQPYKSGFGPFAPEVYRAPYGYCYRCAYNLKYPDCGIALRGRARGLLPPLRRGGAGRGRDRRARARRGRFRRAAGRVPAEPARADRAPRHPADRRRGADRVRPHREAVGGRALGRRARHPDQRQVDRRRPAAGRGDGPRRGDGRGRRRRPRRDVRRQPGLAGRGRGRARQTRGRRALPARAGDRRILLRARRGLEAALPAGRRRARHRRDVGRSSWCKRPRAARRRRTRPPPSPSSATSRAC